MTGKGLLTPYVAVPCPTCGAGENSSCVGPIEVRSYGVHEARAAAAARDRDAVLRWAEAELEGSPDKKTRLGSVRAIHSLMERAQELEDERHAHGAFEQALEESE